MYFATRVVCTTLLGIGLLFSSAVLAQSASRTDRLIHGWIRNIADPVQLRAIDVSGQEVEKEVPFSATDDWLSHLQLLLENDSPKTIVAIKIGLGLPNDVDESRPSNGISVQLGQVPMYVRHVRKFPDSLPDNHALLSFKPTEKLIVRISDFQKDLGQLLKGLGVSSVPSACWLTPETIYFADNTKWSSGNYYVPDPTARSGYSVVPREQFLNYRSAN